MKRVPDTVAEKLSRRLGDVVANRLIKLAGVVGGVPGALGSRLLVTYVEYLRDESPTLIKVAQLEQRKSDLHDLVAGLARLERRLQDLEHPVRGK